MAEPEFEAPSLDQLHSPDQVELFNAIDKLRSHNACRAVGLPQLIVCGDQSSGKSSVLEGLTGLRFPAKDGLCTTFATELVIRRSDHTRLSSKIEPGYNRTPSEKKRLLEFQSSFSSPDDISKLIDDAKAYMTAGSGRSLNEFSEDVLQIHISGPTRVPLTIVDLPGLIHSENDGQTTRDIEFVHNLVARYMKEERSIILAVVSAKAERAAQQIFQYIKKFDEQKLRTLGIITKPDTLDAGTQNEMTYINLALNKSTKLYHGWHVVKNRNFHTMLSTDEERDAAEKDFFSKGNWKLISPNNLGIDSLRTKLGTVLLQHICSELPSLIMDLQKALKVSYQQRKMLGDARTGKDDYQRFLVDISQAFQIRSRDALNGVYHHQFFNSSSPRATATRLRAMVQRLNIEFTEVMYRWGHTTLIVKDGEVATRPRPGLPGLDLQTESPEVMTRSEYMASIASKVDLNRGRELPNTPSPLAIAELFRDQSVRWQHLAEWHFQRVQATVEEFLDICLHSITDNGTCDRLMVELINPAMFSMKQDLDAKLEELISPYTSDLPTTYDPSFTTELQRLQAEHRGYRAQGETGLLPGNFNNLPKAPDYEKQTQDATISECLDKMQAYYNVAISVFVNNVTVIGIEKCLVSKIPGIFDPSRVVRMDENKLEAIAGESEEIKKDRSALEERIRDLESGLQLLSRHARHMPNRQNMPSIHVIKGETPHSNISPLGVGSLDSHQSMSRSLSSSRSTASSLSSSPIKSGGRRASSASSYDAEDAQQQSKNQENFLPNPFPQPRAVQSRLSRLRASSQSRGADPNEDLVGDRFHINLLKCNPEITRLQCSRTQPFFF